MIPESPVVFPDSADSNSEISDINNNEFSDHFGEESSFRTQESMNADGEDGKFTGWSEDPPPRNAEATRQQKSNSGISVVTASPSPKAKKGLRTSKLERTRAVEQSIGMDTPPSTSQKVPAVRPKQTARKSSGGVIIASPSPKANNCLRTSKLERIRAVEQSIGMDTPPSTSQKVPAVRPKQTARKSPGGRAPAATLQRKRTAAESQDSVSSVTNASRSHVNDTKESTPTTSRSATKRRQLPVRKSAGARTPAVASKQYRAVAESQDSDSAVTARINNTTSTSATSTSTSAKKRKQSATASKASTAKRKKRTKTSAEEDADYVFSGSLPPEEEERRTSGREQDKNPKKKRSLNAMLPPDTFIDYDGAIVRLKEYMEKKWWKMTGIIDKRKRGNKLEYLCEWEDTWETRRMFKALKEYNVEGYYVEKLEEVEKTYRGVSNVMFFKCRWAPVWTPAANVTSDIKAAFETKRKEQVKRRRKARS